MNERSGAEAKASFIEPCLPSKVERPPSGPLWVHEIKHDGYRLMVRRDVSRTPPNGKSFLPLGRDRRNNQRRPRSVSQQARGASDMPTAVEHSIIAILKPLEREGTDLSLSITGLPHLPDTLDVGHQTPAEAASLNFTLTGDALHLDMQLLVPAVQHHDFFSG
jgi:hypothetical protein